MAQTQVVFQGLDQKTKRVKVSYYHGSDTKAYKKDTIGEIRRHEATKVWWAKHDDGSKYKGRMMKDVAKLLIEHESAKVNGEQTPEAKKVEAKTRPAAFPRSAGQPKWAHVTAEDITQARDKDGLSWRDVANKFDLGSPGTARKAYTELTGRAHNESVMTGRRAPAGSQKSGSKKRLMQPQWQDSSTEEEVRAGVEGAHRILIDRGERREPEDIQFSRLESVKGTRGGVEVTVRCKLTGGSRVVFAHKILEVR